MSLIRNLLFLIIILTPLIFNLFGFGYEQTKVLFFICFTTTAGSLWLYRKPDLTLSEIQKSQLFFISILWITSFSGINQENSIMGSYPYYQGALIYTLLFLFSVLVSRVKINFYAVSFALSVSALIVSIFALIQQFLINSGFSVPLYSGRVVSTFGQPNFFASQILFSLPFIHYLSKTHPRHSRIFLFTFLILCGGILVSFSRTAIILTCTMILIGIFSLIPKSARFLYLLLISVLFISFIFFSSRNFQGLFYKEVTQPQSTRWIQSNSPEKRILIWPVIVQIILQRPMLGYGLENLNIQFPLYIRALKPELTPLPPSVFGMKDLILDRSHNYFLDLLFFSGILGLGSYLYLIYLLIKKSRKSRVLFCGLILYLIWIQFQNQSITNLIYFFLISGLIDLENDS